MRFDSDAKIGPELDLLCEMPIIYNKLAWYPYRPLGSVLLKCTTGM